MVAAIDGLWLYWVLGLVPVSQTMIVRVRNALQHILSLSQPGARRPAAKRNPNPSRQPAAESRVRKSPARKGAAGRRKQRRRTSQ